MTNRTSQLVKVGYVQSSSALCGGMCSRKSLTTPSVSPHNRSGGFLSLCLALGPIKTSLICPHNPSARSTLSDIKSGMVAQCVEFVGSRRIAANIILDSMAWRNHRLIPNSDFARRALTSAYS